MLDFGQVSPYETFAAIRPRILDRPADISAVAFLGQVVSDVLDNNCSDRHLELMVGDLEAERLRAIGNEINNLWELPLTSLLGLLRQTQHYRKRLEATLNPGDETLREKVLTAIDAGMNTPTEIRKRVRSPSMVVLRVLSDLADEGTVEPTEPDGDSWERPYRRVHADEDVDDNTTRTANTGATERRDTAGRVRIPVWEAEGSPEQTEESAAAPDKSAEKKGPEEYNI